MTYIHKNLASGRWRRFSLVEQMANIGSEVSRVIHWKEKGNKVNQEKAIERALELIDLTIADKRWKSRLLELLRLREVFCDLFIGDNTYNTSFKSLQNYFLFFGLIKAKGA
jgi:hypothetical protein